MFEEKKYLILVLILSVTASVTVFLKPARIDSALDRRIMEFPKQAGAYSSQDIILGQRIYDLLETKNVIMREYKKDGEPPILFYLMFSPQSYKTSDPPENCLIGDGMEISVKSKEDVTLSVMGRSEKLRINKLVAGKANARNLHIYWFLCGDKFTDSYLLQRIKLISGYLRNHPQSAGQIRISTVIDTTDKEAMQRLVVFISEIMPYLVTFRSPRI